MPDPKPTFLATAIRAHVEHARRHPQDVGRALASLTELAEYVSPAEGPVAACACGATYDAEGWAALPLVGEQDDGADRAELRNCTAVHPQRDRCMSTIAIVLGPSLRELPAAGGETADCGGRPPVPGSTASPATPASGPPGPALCSAPGCGRELTTAQLARGAHACSEGCRRASNRARKRARRLAAVDAAVAALAEAREEIARGT